VRSILINVNCSDAYCVSCPAVHEVEFQGGRNIICKIFGKFLEEAPVPKRLDECLRAEAEATALKAGKGADEGGEVNKRVIKIFWTNANEPHAYEEGTQHVFSMSCPCHPVTFRQGTGGDIICHGNYVIDIYQGIPEEEAGREETKQTSNCCGAPVSVRGGTPDFPGDRHPVTMHFACSACGKPCGIKGWK
jgi:hypothetical protein